MVPIEDVTTATARGRELVAAAQAEAEQLVAAAQDLVQQGEQRYADVYSAVTTAGWTPADLDALGFPPAASTRRRQPSAGQREHSAAAAVPQQPAAHD